ncbi:phosphotransferase [Streptomyces sp. B22F1]|uniref:phosphotransferase n=1 Tax=Streptomyces sp. B22F1 TaxID=3153566 RepID=UPI00325E06A3
MVDAVVPVEARDEALAKDLPAILDAFDLGVLAESPRYLADGLMNRNWRVSTSRGRFAVKLIVDVPLDIAGRNLGTLSALASAGIPVCTPLVTSGGNTVVEVDGRGYCVMEWVDGAHVRGSELDLDGAAVLGEQLGQLHRALEREAPGPVPQAPPTAGVTPAAKAMTAADGYLSVIDCLRTPAAFDRAAAGSLEQRKELLAKYADRCPRGVVPAGPWGWTHGDFQYRNILWRGSRVVAVLDWDRLRVRPYAEEVARTAQVQFGVGGRFDLDRMRAFVAGYRRVIDLPADDLADGVHRLWWKRLTDFWQLSFHYKRGDHGCDDLFLADEALLHWWTDRLDEVQDAMAG